jgi:hypothetical protein
LVNCSPKGLDSFRILSPIEVAYLDLTGRGIETLAHLRENSRIILMFCAFEGPPKIVRLHGRGTPILPRTVEFDRLRSVFPNHAGARAIIRVSIQRISDSCGYGVPQLAFRAERETLTQWVESKSPNELAEYRKKKNAVSIEGLPGLPSFSGAAGIE